MPDPIKRREEGIDTLQHVFAKPVRIVRRTDIECASLRFDQAFFFYPACKLSLEVREPAGGNMCQQMTCGMTIVLYHPDHRRLEGIGPTTFAWPFRPSTIAGANARQNRADLALFDPKMGEVDRNDLIEWNAQFFGQENRRATVGRLFTTYMMRLPQWDALRP